MLPFGKKVSVMLARQLRCIVTIGAAATGGKLFTIIRMKFGRRVRQTGALLTFAGRILAERRHDAMFALVSAFGGKTDIR